jgi:hypothetical protein
MAANYATFWGAFKASAAWEGLMAMARFSPDVELRVLRLRVELTDAMAGHANQSDIQEAIWRLMELVGSQSDPAQVGELVGLMQAHGLAELYSLTPP